MSFVAAVRHGGRSDGPAVKIYFLHKPQLTTKLFIPTGVRHGGRSVEPALSELELHVRLWSLLFCDAGTNSPRHRIIDRARTAPAPHIANRPALGSFRTAEI